MENLKKKYINKRYTDKDFEGLGHYISVSDVKDDDKLKKSALEQGESYYLADENGYLIPSNIVHNFLKNKELNRYFTEQSDANDRISQQIKLRAADRQANLLTPGVKTFVVAPLALTAAGIGGATLAPLLAPGTLGGNIIGTTAFGEALNHAIKYGTGKTMGEHAVNAAHYLGIPESKLGDFGIQMIGDMPIYVTGDIIGKQVANTGHTLTKEALDQLALDNRFKGIPINPTTKDLAKAMNKEIKNKQFDNPIPGQIGWAPRQTLTGYHASNEPIQEFKYWYPNWAVREHNAPHGIYFTANETRPSGGFLAKRPYIEQVSSTFDRPMVQVGEIPTSAKNATRNSIERQAQSMGADGIIYQGIKDNQLENQTIVKTLNPDQRINVSEIIENDPYQITKIFDKDKIRLRLPTHTKDLPREIVLEPQGNNQYRIHIRTWNGDHVPADLDSKEKQALFESVYNELPEGAEILFPESSTDYPATRGTIAALTHLSRDPRFQRGNTTGTLIYADKDGNLQTFTGNSFIKGQKPLDSHLQGEDAVKMFKEYGGLSIPEESYIGKSLKPYVQETRVRYGLLGNNNITDQEIAEALYKEIMSEPGISKVGDIPLIGFRGDTRRYTQLMKRYSPEKQVNAGGTMDNSLGNLFLGEYPHEYQEGVDRYLVKAITGPADKEGYMQINVKGSATGGHAKSGLSTIVSFEDYPNVLKQLTEYPIRKILNRRGQWTGETVYKLKPEYSTTKVNDLNAFMFKGEPRDATHEIQVGNVGRTVVPRFEFNLMTDEIPTEIQETEIPLYNWKSKIISPLEDSGVEKGNSRNLMAEHYSNLLKDSESKGQGILFSGSIKHNSPNAHPFRSEHSQYPYFALPNYNINNVKHILPYDLRIPRNWNDPNIYRSLLPFIPAGYGLSRSNQSTSNRKGGN